MVPVDGHETQVAPNTFIGSGVFCCVVLLCFTVTCGYAMVLPSLWPLMQHLGANHVEYSIAAASFSSGAFCGMLGLGALADHLSPKPILLIATGVATLGCALYTVPLSPGMVYPARFLWGLAAGTWPVVLATVRRCSASMGELSRATMLASQAQTLGYVAGPGVAWLASLVDTSVTVYEGVEVQWLLPAVIAAALLLCCFSAMAVLNWPGRPERGADVRRKTPAGLWAIIGLQMVVNCLLAAILAVVECTGPAITITEYGWSTTQNAVFWFGQAIIGFCTSTLLSGGIVERWSTAPPHLSVEMWLAQGDRSNSAFAHALVLLMSAVQTPIRAVSRITLTEGRCITVRLQLPEKELSKAAAELDSVPQVLHIRRVVKSAVYHSVVVVATQAVLLACSLAMIRFTDLDRPVSSSRYTTASLIAATAWTPAFISNLICQQRVVPPSQAGWLFALQGALACASRALAPIWGVPIWHHMGMSALFMVISGLYAAGMALSLAALHHHHGQSVREY
eukprot:EG_transcript_7072